MTFRWFADAEPQEDGIMIKIQKSRKETPQIIHIKLEQEVAELEEILKEAYETIR